jgi:hypothetical protein
MGVRMEREFCRSQRESSSLFAEFPLRMV